VYAGLKITVPFLAPSEVIQMLNHPFGAVAVTITLLFALLFPIVPIASDHIDGPVTRREGGADITDLYAFPAEDAGRLVLIMNLYPLLPGNGHFLEAVSYEFLLRPAAATGSGLATGFTLGDEVKIACRFAGRGKDEPEIVSCSGGDISISGSLGETLGDPATDGGRLFAGPRADAFFFHGDWARQASKQGLLQEPENDNIMADTNVLSIVLELDIAGLGLGNAKLLAIAAQTMTQDDESAPWRRLDRVGRPEITNVSMVAHDDDRELRDSYNQLEPFSANKQDLALYRERLRRNIAFFDAIDQVRDWPSPWLDLLADLLVHDYLVVDPGLPCSGASYFEIESSLMRRLPHTRCGGRVPEDDVMDTIFTLLINGGHGRQVRDGVDAPSPDLPDGFPYLAEPNSGIKAWIKARFGQESVRPQTVETGE
jgi:hypothetical protein